VKAVLALDLDQTLIYSQRSAGPLDGVETVWVEDYDGGPLSLMTAEAHRLLGELSQQHHVVPVTTRTPEQYARVRLPVPPEYAICCNGGVLLRDGERDREWDDRVAEDLTGVASADVVASKVFAVRDEPWVRTVRQVEHLFVYLVAHSREAIPEAWITEIADYAGDLGWTVSVQGRKVYVVPAVLSKGAAAVRVATMLGGPLLAAGDSLLDTTLLEVATVAARPAHGELHVAGWQRPGLYVSPSSGARAADEILSYLGLQADATVPTPSRHRPPDR
jgi:hydroxymethylpyrimidine pyrophosphatase-like HAD family hydrolase